MELEFYLLGVLAEDEELKERYTSNYKAVKFKDTGDITFVLKILNEDDIPKKYLNTLKNTFVFGYDNQINDMELDKILKGSLYHERDDYFTEYAKSKVFIFKPYIAENQYGENKVNVAHNSLKIVDRPDSFSGRNPNSLITIPIFNDFNKYEFEKRLLNNESIGKFDNVTNLPSCIISGEYLYGEIDSSELLNDGWHVVPHNSFKKVAIDFDKYKDQFIKHNNSFYIDYKFFEDIFLNKGLIELGREVNIEKEVEIKTDISSNDDFEDSRYIERDFIDDFKDMLDNQGLIYSNEQLLNFHIAMKTHRLVILNGASGTGKTQLIYQYAKSLGMTKDDSNQFKLIPVKPSWKDDTDLIGFLDTINNIYRPSESGLIDTLIEASKNKTKKIYIICFDEMNLSKIEHYFSQFLSILEMEPKERKISLYSKHLIGRVFNGDQYPHEITIGDNVLFVGTINNDESTESISDKVLDRCNYININVSKNHIENWINLNQKENNISEVTKNIKVSYQDYSDWSNLKKVVNLSKSEINVLNKINNLLSDNFYGIGFRALNHINNYLNNLIEYEDFTRERAFDLQLAQKVIPKLRGTKEELDTILFNEDKGIKSILNKEFYPNSRALIEDKCKEIELYGFTY